MDNVILNLTNDELCTILTALKKERNNAVINHADEAVLLIDAALNAITSQPWDKNGREF